MKLDLERQGDGRTELAIEGSLQLGLPDGRTPIAEVHGTLLVDNLDSRYLVNGSLQAGGRAECSRCLEDFDLSWEVPVEIMVLRDVETDEGQDDSQVLHQKTGIVDLADPLRESVILAYPLAPTCREDCKGICVQCGADLNQKACGCEDVNVDPRWEGLP